jgi:hypothetical protein
MQNTPAEGELAIRSFVCSRPLPMTTQAPKFSSISKFEARGSAVDYKRHGGWSCVGNPETTCCCGQLVTRKLRPLPNKAVNVVACQTLSRSIAFRVLNSWLPGCDSRMSCPLSVYAGAIARFRKLSLGFANYPSSATEVEWGYGEICTLCLASSVSRSVFSARSSGQSVDDRPHLGQHHSVSYAAIGSGLKRNGRYQRGKSSALIAGRISLGPYRQVRHAQNPLGALP